MTIINVLSALMGVFLLATGIAMAEDERVSAPREAFTNSLGVVMRPIPAGSFQMGQADARNRTRILGTKRRIPAPTGMRLLCGG